MPNTTTENPKVSRATKLSDEHQKLLSDRAVDLRVAEERGYFTINSSRDSFELEQLGFFTKARSRTATLVIPVYNVTGKVSFYLLRPDDPRKNSRGKVMKYEFPPGQRMVIDCHPRLARRNGDPPVVADPSIPIWITEGIPKADAAISIGLACLALIGVWNFRGSNEAGGKTALADWESIALNDREVCLAFDSDVMQKKQVAQALARLRSLLKSRGARVKLVYLAPAPDGRKTGLDDFIAREKLAGTRDEQIREQLLSFATYELRASNIDYKGATKDASQADRLIALATSNGDLFRDREGMGYVTISLADHAETHPIRARTFKNWLIAKYLTHHQKSPGSDGLTSALRTIEAIAQFGGESRDLAVRIAGAEGKVYVDLCNEKWQAVEITPDGWSVIESKDCPTRFIRRRGMLPLPIPQHGGNINNLKRFVRGSDDDFKLMTGWVIAAYQPNGPFPILDLGGDHGSGKSTVARVLRSCLDPNFAPIRAKPKEVRDLMIAASASRVVALDNLSDLPDWLSDALCRLATGGGFSTRELYTDADEIIFDAKRPVIVNGIGDALHNADVLDRAMRVALDEIPDDQRKTEDAFWREFNEAHPLIIGAIFDAVSCSLRKCGEIEFKRLPRMADAAIWIEAAAPALGWKREAFLEAYQANRAAADQEILDDSIVATTLTKLLDAKPDGFTDSASVLLERLSRMAKDDDTSRLPDGWPKSPRGMSAALRRIRPNLRKIGVVVEFYRERSGRVIKITRA